MNRFWDYQKLVRQRKSEFDVFHLIDHSYGQLVHTLPAAKTIVTCHDLDAFRSLLQPQTDPRSQLFKTMSRHVLNGFCKAARVACDSVAIRDELLMHGLIAVELLNGERVTRAGRLFNLRSAPFCPQMVRKIRASKAALVHIHLPNPGAVLAYLASGHRGRLVITYHSDFVRQKVLSRVLDPILQHALNRADAIIVSSSNYIKSSYVLPFYQNKCRVIPFGIPLDHFQRPDAAEVARLPHLYGPRIVLGVGRLVYYKGFEHLIEAMNFIQGRLVIVGHGPLHNALQQKAESCGVSERVTFLTDVQDVRPYYHAADVFALSSVARSEAFGIVQLEAMACGKPVGKYQAGFRCTVCFT